MYIQVIILLHYKYKITSLKFVTAIIVMITKFTLELF